MAGAGAGGVGGDTGGLTGGAGTGAGFPEMAATAARAWPRYARNALFVYVDHGEKFVPWPLIPHASVAQHAGSDAHADVPGWAGWYICQIPQLMLPASGLQPNSHPRPDPIPHSASEMATMMLSASTLLELRNPAL